MENGSEGEKRKSVTDRVTTESFSRWYRTSQRRKDLKNGRIEPIDDEKTETNVFSPHALGRCQRRALYDHHDAPRETRRANGILSTGTYFEEEIVLPYLADGVARSSEVVRNSIWIDFSVEVEGSTLTFQGLTDPVLLDEDGYPILLVEVKTKSTLDRLEEPSDHHLPQVYAYQRGLSEKYDIDPPDAVLLYGSRETFQIRVFDIPFDQREWEKTVEWARKQKEYRDIGKLPTDTPEQDWECSFCDYQHRCGRAETDYEDVGGEGFLPRFEEYPQRAVEQYLRGHEHARLTPTLADRYPELAGVHGVFDWECWHCAETYEFGTVGWDGNPAETPLCPACLSNEIPSPLSGPRPSDQLRTEVEES